MERVYCLDSKNEREIVVSLSLEYDPNFNVSLAGL